jgi:hypothetical protein
MTCFSPALLNRLAKAGPDIAAVAAIIETNYAKLQKQQREAIGVPQDTEEVVTSSIFFAFWQAQIHRGARLTVTCGSAIDNEDPYGLAVLIRAFVETTAVFLSVYSKFDKWIMSESTYSEFDLALTSATFGQRHEDSGRLPMATNILTHIKNADAYIDQRAPIAIHAPISTMYGALSEYAHPNFASNKQGMALNREKYEFRIRHNEGLNRQHLEMLGTLSTASLLLGNASDKVDALFSRTGTLFAVK